MAPSAEAQIPGQHRGHSLLADSTRRRAGRIDTASARRLGLPTAPSRSFPGTGHGDGRADGASRATSRPGTSPTRANLNNSDRAVRLGGRAMTERDSRILEAAHIEYREAGCDLVAQGDPRMFEGQQVLVGNQVRYDTCMQRGVVDEALTTFDQGMGNWYIRGNLGVDSSAVRVFAAHSEITSCDLPIPDYHFRGEGGEVGVALAAGGATRRALRARRADRLDPVHFPGDQAGAPLRHPGAPIRVQ